MQVHPAGRVVPCQAQHVHDIAVIRGSALMSLKLYPGRHGRPQVSLLRHEPPPHGVFRGALGTHCGVVRRVERCRLIQFQDGLIYRLTVRRCVGAETGNAVAFMVLLWQHSDSFVTTPLRRNDSLPPLALNGGSFSFELSDWPAGFPSPSQASRTCPPIVRLCP